MGKIKNNSCILIIVILIFIIGGMVLNYSLNKKDFVPVSKKENIEKEEVQKKKDKDTVVSVPSKEIWETYTNSELGFSIKYPQMVAGLYSCSPKKSSWVPIKVFEDKKDGIVYITEEYYYSDWDRETQSNTGSCKKIINSLELLQKEKEEMQKGEFSLWWKPFLGWAISTGNIKNENELNKFIKDNYSSGCFAESRNSWQQQAGVYEIKLNGFKDAKGNNTDLGNAVCPVNYVYKILYISEKDKVMSVKLGQECNFRTNLTKNYKCYDDKMINSFKFE